MSKHIRKKCNFTINPGLFCRGIWNCFSVMSRGTTLPNSCCLLSSGTCRTSCCEIQVFTAMMIQVAVFCVVIPCTDIAGYQRFGEPCCLHSQGENLKMEVGRCSEAVVSCDIITRRHNSQDIE